MTEIRERLTALRAEMKKLGLDACMITGTDPHSSEYLPERWQTRRFISGFTGSYGTVVVTAEEAGLWTDTRYFIQAEEQLKGTGIDMHKLRVPNALPPEDWMAKNLVSGQKVGVDAQTISVAAYHNLETVLLEQGVEVMMIPDLFESLWLGRPKIPDSPIVEHDVRFSGWSRQRKIQEVEDRLESAGAEIQIVTTLDELAWLFNLRGSDVNYNPVFTGFAVAGKGESYLFTHRKKLSNETLAILESEEIVVQEYEEFYEFLTTLKNKRISIDPATANYLVYRSLVKNNELIEGQSVVSTIKAIKNDHELNGFRNAMKKDGVAMVKFLYWLQENVGTAVITEYDTGVKLRELRSEQEAFVGESFPPIVGYKSHGAVVHLSAGPEDALPVEKEGILLFDSGGQYLDGTTDITRTVALGSVSDRQKKDFTLVLKGMIGLTMARFPSGTKGCNVDILARHSLWQNGLNYGHGTGHGVGHFLNVHEGPVSIRQELINNVLEPGMVMSNEPALYREGEYGIRTENMMVCVEVEKTEYGHFFGFETLTLCPIDTRLILPELLTQQEKKWLNDYHTKVKNELIGELDIELQEYLEEITRSI